MAATTHEIAFQIAGKLASGFTSTFKAANKAVENYNTQLNALNKRSADIDNVVRLRKEVAYSARDYIQAKQKVAELGRAISQSQQPTKQMIANFNAAKKALDKSKISLDKNRQSLQSVETTAGTAGTKLQTLIQRQKDLKTQTDKAIKAQEKQAQLMGSIKGSWGGVKENAPYAAMSGAAMGAGIGGSISAAMSFEDQRADLRKYNDDYENIFSDIQNLTMEYGKTAEDMTKMATAAMQSGIVKTREDVKTIIEAQTQAAVAFEMTGDQVGSAWADIQGKMGLSVGKTKEVFDIINQLGNETNASSADVIEVLQRQGGALKGLTALTAEQITGLAGAFRSASTSSEVAATSMGTFIGRLTNGSSATGTQKKALETLGLDAVTLAKQLTGTSSTAQKAIQDVFAQINKLPEHEKGAVIGQLFGTESGIKSAVSTLASQSDILSKNIEIVGDKSKYSGSMFKEYESRASTTSEQLKIMQNIVTLVSAKIGDVFLPYIREATDWIKSNADNIIEWVTTNKDLIAILASAAAGIAACTAAAVPLFIAWKTLSFYWNAAKLTLGLITLLFKKNTYSIIANKVALVANKVAMVASRVAMVAWRGVMLIVTAAQWAWNAAMTANPIGLVIAGLAALIAVGVLVYRNWDVIKAKAIELWNTFSEKFPTIAAIFSEHFGRIKDIAMDVKDVFMNIIGFVKNVFTGEWSAAWENVKNAFGSAFSALTGLVKMPFNGVISTVNAAIKSINSAVSQVKVPDWVPIWGGKEFSFNIPEIPQLATGGIATKPTLAMIGEGNESEAVLPLSKLKSLISGGAGGGGSISVNFAPTINISGGSGSYGEVKRGLEEGQANLKRELEKLLNNQRRLSYV